MKPLLLSLLHTLSGKITDAETGEDLIGVSILATGHAKGTITNSYGFYSLSLPQGTYTIRYSYLGYETAEHVKVSIKTMC